MAVAAAGLAAAASRDTTSPPVVYAADVDSIIHPVSAEYMIETMDRADRAGVALVVFTLRTPGGLVVLCHFQLLNGGVQALDPSVTLTGVRRLLQVSR